MAADCICIITGLAVKILNLVTVVLNADFILIEGGNVTAGAESCAAVG